MDLSILSLLTGNFKLIQGDKVIAKVRGYNSLGPGAYSDVSTSIALIVSKPHALTAIPIRNFPSSTKTTIAADMPAISNGLTSGGLAITSYSL